MRLTVVIVSYNVKYFLEQCLLSLRRALERIESEVYVVDNHSRDGSVDHIRGHFEGLNIIESNHNLGFAKANNLAIRRARGEYVLLLNPDTIVGETTIARALDFMDHHERAGGVGVMMHNADGSLAMESRRGLPTPITSFYKMSGLCRMYPRSRRFAKYYMSYLSWHEEHRIEVISGAFCLLRRKALDEVGLLDEDFFMYGEDIDLSCRLLKGGWQNWYLPLPIIHYKGESTQKTSFRYVHVFYNAMLIFLRKHYSNLSLLAYLPIKLAIHAKAFLTLVSMQMNRMRRAMGLAKRQTASLTYHFLLGPEATKECKEIAARRGLTAEFHALTSSEAAADEAGSMADHIRTHWADGIIVLDTSLVSYADIMGIMARQPSRAFKLGTYSPETKTIITPSDILR